jgi:hypothetical protein
VRSVTNNVFDLTGDATQIIGLYQDIGGSTNFGMMGNVFSRNIVLTSLGFAPIDTSQYGPVAACP